MSLTSCSSEEVVANETENEVSDIKKVETLEKIEVQSNNIETSEDDINININIDIDIDDDFTIYTVTDIHYLSNSINDHGEAFQTMVESSDGRQVNYIDEILEAFKYEVIKNEPDLLIVSGDLTHNGEKASHLDVSEKLKEIEESGVEVLVIPGNHDINNPYAREFKEDKQIKTDFITAEEFEEIYSEFGYSEAVYRDKNSLSYLTMPKEDLWILMLDSSIYESNIVAPTTGGKFSQETMKWIKECGELAKENNAQVVTSLHHNLYKHSDLLYNGFVIENAEEIVALFEELNFKISLSGHIHIQDIMANENKTVYDIVTSGFIVYPVQYGILEYNKGDFLYRTKEVDVEKWAVDFEVDNQDLLNFKEYSRNNFYDKSYNQTLSALVENYNYDSKKAELMANVMATLNVNYFGGTTNEVYDDIVTSVGYDLWTKSEDDFLKTYVLDMAEKNEYDYNYFDFR
ncbi:MAG: metallophosphoesterase [Lachnospirales bacterium]